MRLIEIIREDLIRIDLEARSKTDAIRQLVDLLIAGRDIAPADREPVLEAVLHREASMSTGMDHGVALPHGTLEGLEEVVGALGISKEGVPFETLDGKLAHLVILLLIPKNKFQIHVKTMAGIARLLNQQDLRERLIHVTSAEQAFGILEEEENR